MKLGKLTERDKEIIQHCISVCNELAENIDNGDIFSDRELEEKYSLIGRYGYGERWSAAAVHCAKEIEENFLG